MIVAMRFVWEWMGSEDSGEAGFRIFMLIGFLSLFGTAIWEAFTQ